MSLVDRAPPFLGGNQTGPTRVKHIDYDLTRSLRRVTITDAKNPGDRLANGLLNPQTFRYSAEVEIGELNPVGWSGSVLNYGHTKSGAIPIELYFSTQLSQRVSGFEALTYYADWIGGFCFPTKKGQAPPVMLLIWPNVAEITLVVKSYSVDMVRFHLKNLMPSAVRVKIETRELSVSHRTASTFRRDGLRKADPLIVGGSGNTGTPVNFQGGVGSKIGGGTLT